MTALPKLSINSCLETVNSHFRLPYQPYPFQQEAIQELYLNDRIGMYAEPGCGKTLMSTVIGLYHLAQNSDTCVVVTMPPILLNSWYRWLKQIGGVNNVVVYRGTPAQRKALDLSKAQFVLMSMNIFKNDNARLVKELEGRPLVGIVDEATSVKNSASDNYRMTRDFFAGHVLMLLTGTPLSHPGDVYAYVKLIAPMIYRSHRQFENVHVAERDFFNNVTKWQNLELMKSNLLTHSVRILKEEVLTDLHEPIYTPIFYELDPAHRRLYEQLMEEQLLLLDDGGKIDAASATRLYHAAQQIIFNLDVYSGRAGARSAAMDVVDETISEMGIDNGSGKKLLVSGQYKQTNRKLTEYLAPYGAVACYSEVSKVQQARNVDFFTDDPACQVLVVQPTSAGYGLNLQEACSDELFIETPVVPAHFHQTVARVYRDGQKQVPHIRIAVAERTIQVRLYNQLLQKDALVNQIQVGYKDLRDMIYGAP